MQHIFRYFFMLYDKQHKLIINRMQIPHHLSDIQNTSKGRPRHYDCAVLRDICTSNRMTSRAIREKQPEVYFPKIARKGYAIPG